MNLPNSSDVTTIPDYSLVREYLREYLRANHSLYLRLGHVFRALSREIASMKKITLISSQGLARGIELDVDDTPGTLKIETTRGPELACIIGSHMFTLGKDCVYISISSDYTWIDIRNALYLSIDPSSIEELGTLDTMRTLWRMSRRLRYCEQLVPPSKDYPALIVNTHTLDDLVKVLEINAEKDLNDESLRDEVARFKGVKSCDVHIPEWIEDARQKVESDEKLKVLREFIQTACISRIDISYSNDGEIKSIYVPTYDYIDEYLGYLEASEDMIEEDEDGVEIRCPNLCKLVLDDLKIARASIIHYPVVAW